MFCSGAFCFDIFGRQKASGDPLRERRGRKEEEEEEKEEEDDDKEELEVLRRSRRRWFVYVFSFLPC